MAGIRSGMLFGPSAGRKKWTGAGTRACRSGGCSSDDELRGGGGEAGVPQARDGDGPELPGHGPTLFAGLSNHVDLNLVSRLEFGSGAVAMRYEPRR
jgi:hypothetical protein